MDLFSKFNEFVLEESLSLKGRRLLLAVSGGVDSVVLAHLCKKSGYDFAIAHCNFKLRGEESDLDEQFVKGLAAEWGVEFLSKHFDTEAYASESKSGIQEAARELRYNWFYSLMKPASVNGFDYLLTAHQADDNIETLLMNFFKGTGINGLKAILPQSDRLIRPMLFAFKEDVLAYAGKEGIGFREDSSNIRNKYTRNYFRNELIPAVEKVFPAVRKNLLNNIDRFREVHSIYDYALKGLRKKIMVIKGEEIHIPVLLLMKAPGSQSVLHEILSPLGFTAHQAEEVLSLLQSPSGKYVLSSTHRVLRNRNWLIVSPLASREVRHFLVEKEDKAIDCGDLSFHFSLQPPPEKISTDKSVALLDAAQIKYPILIRRWKQGDYFYPFGMRKKKKLSRFFIDEKISITEKEKCWVMESAGRIIWLAGHRIDDRFKITPDTKVVLHISIQ